MIFVYWFVRKIYSWFVKPYDYGMPGWRPVHMEPIRPHKMDTLPAYIIERECSGIIEVARNRGK